VRGRAEHVAPAQGAVVSRRRQPQSVAEQARRIVRDLEASAELTGDEWPTAASVRGTADHLSRTPETAEDAAAWYAAAALLEAKESVV